MNMTVQNIRIEYLASEKLVFLPLKVVRNHLEGDQAAVNHKANPENTKLMKPIKTKKTNIVRTRFVVCATTWLAVFAGNTLATQTPLMFRNESPQQIHGGLTDHILDTSWGTNVLTLPFTGTTTYDFYTPRLAAPSNLSATGNGGTAICMSNTGQSTANNVSVAGGMKYYDYDPDTGAETLILDTGSSSTKNINSGQTVGFSTPTAAMPGDYTIPAGHMLHAALTIALVSGDPGTNVALVYNAPAGSNKYTEAQLSQNSSNSTLSWQLVTAPPPALSIFEKNNGQMSLTGYGSPMTTYAVQCTSDLTSGNWVTLTATVSDEGGLYNFTDKDAPNHPCRFYRSISQ